MSEDTVVYGESQGFCDAAIAYARLGFHVFPLVPNGKTPLIAGGFKAATTNTAQITAWWAATPRANIGIATGESGLVVIDLDVKGGVNGVEAWQDLYAKYGFDVSTWLVETPTGGTHCYFRANGHGIASSAGKLGRGIDVRATGGYVVAPPSIVNGKKYRWLQDPSPETLVNLPDALASLLRDGSNGNGTMLKPPVDIDSDVPEGERNDTLTRWVGKKLAEGVPPAQAYEMAKMFNFLHCKPPLPVKEVNTIVRSIVKREAEKKDNKRRGYDGDLPLIDATNRHLPDISGKALAALELKNKKNPHLFLHNGLIKLGQDKDGMIILTKATLDDLRYEMARSAFWYVPKKNDKVPVEPPMSVVRDVFVSHLPFFPLSMVTRVPIFDEDGILETTPGYHEKTRTYYHPVDGGIIKDLPDNPTIADVEDAKHLILDELLADFYFASNADRAHAVALLLLPFVRNMIDGPTPLHFIEASNQGAGKGLLANVILNISTGGEVGTLSPPKHDEEIRKSITSRLLEGRAAVIMDNVTVLTSSVLAAALTADIWDDRALGQNATIRGRIRWAWVATGNNAVVNDDIARRCVRIRLLSDQEKPWLRPPDDFVHPEINLWVRKNYGELRRAALILVKSWLAAGKPPAEVIPIGSFESWSKVIGGILQCAGIDGFLGNILEFFEIANNDDVAWRALVKAWWDKFKDVPVRVSDIYPLAKEIEGFYLGKNDNERAQQTSLGMNLKRRKDRIYDGYRITLSMITPSVANWRLIRVASKDEKDDEAPLSGDRPVPF